MQLIQEANDAGVAERQEAMFSDAECSLLLQESVERVKLALNK